MTSVTTVTAVSALLAEADSAREACQWDQAVESYQKFLGGSPDAVVVCRKLAEVLAIRGRYKAVILTCLHIWEVVEAHDDLEGMESIVERLLELQPESEELWAKKIELLWRQNKKEEAVALSRELAPVALARGQDDLALDLLQRAYKEDGQNLPLGIQVAETLLSHGRIQDAQRLYRTIAKTYLEHNDSERAAEAFKRLIVLVPGDAALLLILGDLYVNLGRHNEAEQQYRAMLKIDLNHVEGLLGLAKVCHFKGQYRDAVLALTRILQTHPDELRAHERLGEVYRVQGLHQESNQHFLMAALACVECGAPRKAQQFFQFVLETDPRNTVAIRGLHEIEGRL